MYTDSVPQSSCVAFYSPRTGEPIWRQCAWCKRLIDGTGAPHGWPQSRLWPATHGACQECSAALLRQKSR
jgi:hypothetical protein